MSSETGNSLKFIAIAAIIWNGLGVAMYLMSTMAAPGALVEAYGQELADMYAAKPAWATGAFALSVFAGLIGSIGLFLRKSWSRSLFAISLLSVLAHDFWGFSAGVFAKVGGFDKIMTLVVLVIAIFLLWFSHKKIQEGVLT